MVEKEHLIDLKNISKEFDGVTVLDNINLYIRKKEFVTLLGPSGCGKTTTLRLIAGFLEPNSGTVNLRGKNITGVPPYRRPVNTVFQKYALFPHLNVFENVAFGLRLKKLDEAVIRTKVRDMLEVVGLKGFERRSISQMSGGQQQRVAIARALALHPDILCFDEPTSALDPELTGEVLKVIRALAEQKTTMMIVTHEMAFARDVADQVIFMDGGVIVEQGPARQLIERPRQERTKQFLARYAQER